MDKWINVRELKYNILKMMGDKETVSAVDIAKLIDMTEQVEFEPNGEEAND